MEGGEVEEDAAVFVEGQEGPVDLQEDVKMVPGAEIAGEGILTSTPTTTSNGPSPGESRK